MAQNTSERVRLVDIARECGVSAAVVSAVLRSTAGTGTTRVGEKTANKVRQAARTMGYRPNAAARQLRGAKCDLLGVLIGADSTTANFNRLSAVERAAYARGNRLMIGQFHADPSSTRSYLQDFLSRGIESLMCFHNPAPKYDPEVLELFAQFRSAVFQTRPAIATGNVVDVDRAHGVEEAVKYLATKGRTRIALVLNGHPEKDLLMEDRRRGWSRAVEELGLKQCRDLVWHGDGAFPPGRALVDGAVEQLVRWRADAVIASNDVWAIEVIKGLRRAGKRVPQDLSVIGFDNVEAAALFDPALTTIDQNNADFAQAAVELALLPGQVKEEEHPATQHGRTIVVPPRLIVRESA